MEWETLIKSPGPSLGNLWIYIICIYPFTYKAKPEALKINRRCFDYCSRVFTTSSGTYLGWGSEPPSSPAIELKIIKEMKWIVNKYNMDPPSPHPKLRFSRLCHQQFLCDSPWELSPIHFEVWLLPISSWLLSTSKLYLNFWMKILYLFVNLLKKENTRRKKHFNSVETEMPWNVIS